ncbi:MFS general substrate transporter [Myriangium duriaei CBS 260.36]|uniref:MFS general substrate transporter n=1 Tax=Myriangium duriaei CBS 260.36 TaxID=1168546 RepID=A0A9P4IXT7_9PEZI|nr:MFS general substrate transporter [Myriangium duriaei CBS 260.36]
MTDLRSEEKPLSVHNRPLSAKQCIWHALTWMPQRCRWNPEKPPVFGVPMNILFAFAGAFTVANLYYNQPILNILAESFGVSYETSSHVPTLVQSGYCAGLFLLCPLGDLLRRRYLTLGLIFFTSTVWIGLCVTRSFVVFQVLTFITGFTTVTPQLMLPLVGDLAPAHKRAISLSIVSSGNLGGILIARILSGVVTNYVNWRVIYWIALGLQYAIFVLLFCFMPDYPSTNPSGLSYYRLLIDVCRMLFKHPVLAQSALIGFCTSATFTSFWTTLTFLLAGSPYHYSPVIIGLFALINISALLMTPIYARTFIEKLVPMVSAIIGQLCCLAGVLIGTLTGRTTVAGPIIFAFFLDAGFQITQIANRSAIYSCEPKGRNRINTSFMVVSFLGQVTGTSAGNRLYAQSGWIASGGLSIGLIGFSLFLLTLRGPYEDRWIGWRGGASMKKKDKMSADGRPTEPAEPQKNQGRVDQHVPIEEGRMQEQDLEKGNLERAMDEQAGIETAHETEEQSSKDEKESQASKRHSKDTVDDEGRGGKV